MIFDEMKKIDLESKAKQIGSQKLEVLEGNVAEASIEGQVACRDGPIANVNVSVGMISTTTDPKGNFLIEHVPPGIVKISAKAPSTKYYSYEKNLLLEGGKKKEGLYIFLTEVAGTIEGTVLDESGKPLTGVELSGPLISGKPAMITTDDNGHYVFADVPQGIYFVRAIARGHMIETASVSVTRECVTVSNFVLRAGELSINGKVLDKKTQAPVDCEIYLKRRGIVVTRRSVMKSGNGTFVFDDLAADTYEIQVISQGHVTANWQEKLDKSETVNFELEEARPVTRSCGYDE